MLASLAKLIFEAKTSCFLSLLIRYWYSRVLKKGSRTQLKAKELPKRLVFCSEIFVAVVKKALLICVVVNFEKQSRKALSLPLMINLFLSQRRRDKY